MDKIKQAWDGFWAEYEKMGKVEKRWLTFGCGLVLGTTLGIVFSQ